MLLFYRPNPCTYYTAYLDFADWTDSASFTPLKTVNFSPPDRGFTAMLPGNYNFVLFYDGDTQLYLDKMLDNGKRAPGWNYYVPKPWTHVVAASNGMFLFYNQNNGSGAAAFVRDPILDYEMLHTAKAYENFSFDTTWSLISAW